MTDTKHVYVCRYEYGYYGSDVKVVFTNQEDAMAWIKRADEDCGNDQDCGRMWEAIPLDPKDEKVAEEQVERESVVDIYSLVGQHWLSGAGYGQPVTNGSEEGSVFQLVLDGRQYDFVENPDDGYRSYLSEVFVSDEITVDNTFPPVKVYIKGKPDDPDEEIIYGYTDGGGFLFAVGTENTDDYYPYYVGEWHPENMPQGGN
jgi:hypothetical protein